MITQYEVNVSKVYNGDILAGKTFSDVPSNRLELLNNIRDELPVNHLNADIQEYRVYIKKIYKDDNWDMDKYKMTNEACPYNPLGSEGINFILSTLQDKLTEDNI